MIYTITFKYFCVTNESVMDSHKWVKNVLECLNMEISENHPTRDHTYWGTCIEKYPENIHIWEYTKMSVNISTVTMIKKMTSSENNGADGME